MIVIFLGPPGSGKGTQAEALAKSRGWVKLSTGDMLRQEVAAASELGKKIDSIIQSGALVPDELVTSAVESAIKHLPQESFIILDGDPRSLAQAEALQALLPNLQQKIGMVFDFAIADQVILARLAGRAHCTNCNTTIQADPQDFNNNSLIDPCPSCHSHTLVRRKDDKPEIIANRLEIFHKAHNSIAEFYKNSDIIQQVNADMAPPEVAKQIDRLLSPLFA